MPSMVPASSMSMRRRPVGLPGQRDSRFSSARVTDDPDIWLGRQRPGEEITPQRLVFNDQQGHKV